MTSPPLADILLRFRAEPSRLWSVVVTVFGDAIVPRGGSVWLGTLHALFGALGIGEGAVRTAVSRLTADGWLVRTRQGRNSFYRLEARALEAVLAAAHQIYAARDPDGGHGLTLAIPPAGERRDTAAALAGAGFGAARPGLWIAPGGRGLPPGAAGALLLQAEGEPDDLRRLAADAWPLDRMAASYRRYLETFGSLQEAVAADLELSDDDAMAARTLAIHAYRRLILRHPALPTALHPPDWPGPAARAVCAGLYRALLPASERWLDRYGRDETGPLPPADPALAERFRSG